MPNPNQSSGRTSNNVSTKAHTSVTKAREDISMCAWRMAAAMRKVVALFTWIQSPKLCSDNAACVSKQACHMYKSFFFHFRKVIFLFFKTLLLSRITNMDVSPRAGRHTSPMYMGVYLQLVISAGFHRKEKKIKAHSGSHNEKPNFERWAWQNPQGNDETNSVTDKAGTPGDSTEASPIQKWHFTKMSQDHWEWPPMVCVKGHGSSIHASAQCTRMAHGIIKVENCLTGRAL